MEDEGAEKSGSDGFARWYWVEHEGAKEQLLKGLAPEARRTVERSFAISSVPIDFERAIETARKRCAGFAPGSQPADQAAKAVISSEGGSDGFYAGLVAYYATMLELHIDGASRNTINRLLGARCVEWELSQRNKKMARHGRRMTPASDDNPSSTYHKTRRELADAARDRDKAACDAFAEI